MEVSLWEVAFGVFSIFMLKFVWDLTSYAEQQNKLKEASVDPDNPHDEQALIRRKVSNHI